MDEARSTSESRKLVEQADPQPKTPAKKLMWETPKLEDVSEQVMAQPYIRFT